MTRGLLAGVASLFILMGWPATPALASGFFVEAKAGGGYDSNLNAASNSADAEDSGFVFAAAALGLESDPGRLRSQVTAGWSGRAYPEFSDLSVNRLALSAGLFASPTERLVLSLSPSVGGSFYGGSERDSFDLHLGVGLRWRAHSHLTLRPGYALDYQDAKAAEFDRTAHRFSLALGVDAWSGGYLEAVYAFEIGQVVRYLDQPATSESSGMGSGRPNNTFGGSQLAVREDSTSSEISLMVEQDLTEALFVTAIGGYSRVSADPADYDIFYTSVSLGLRWP